MPGLLERSQAVISSAEIGLRELLSEAASEGDYEAVARIVESAKDLAAAGEKLSTGNVPTNGHAAGTATPTVGNPMGYPKFFRSADHKLVMLGWSKKGSTEYEHRAPRNVLNQLVSALRDTAPAGEPVTIDHLLPMLTGDDGAALPQYYGRTFLRWLRAIGLVKKHGHAGYTVVDPTNFEREAAAYWRRLASR